MAQGGAAPLWHLNAAGAFSNWWAGKTGMGSGTPDGVLMNVTSVGVQVGSVFTGAGDAADAGVAADAADSGSLVGFLGSSTGTAASSTAAEEAAAGATEPTAGQTIYRVYGGDSKAGGASWSPVDPRSVPDFRDAAGLLSGGASGAANTGRFVIEGTLTDPSAVVLQRSALPLDGMKGGLPEYIIPNWLENGSVMIRRVSGVNPEF